MRLLPHRFTHHLCFFLRHLTHTLLEYEPLDPAPVLRGCLVADWPLSLSVWAAVTPPDAAEAGIFARGT